MGFRGIDEIRDFSLVTSGWTVNQESFDGELLLSLVGIHLL